MGNRDTRLLMLRVWRHDDMLVARVTTGPDEGNDSRVIIGADEVAAWLSAWLDDV